MQHIKETPRFAFYDAQWKDQSKGTYYGYRKEGDPVPMKLSNGKHYTQRLGTDGKRKRVECYIEDDNSVLI